MQRWTPTRRYQFTKPIWLTYVLHSRHGQISGTHFLILLLKISTDSDSRHGQISGIHFLILLLKISTDSEDFMFLGINSKIFGPR